MPADEGPYVTAPHTPGRTTLLMYACSQGDLAQVKRLLHTQPGSAVDRDRTLKTALHYCAGGNNRPVASTVYGTSANSSHVPLTPAPLNNNSTHKNNNYITPGGEPGLAHCADLLVMAAPALVDTRDADGFTPLHLAVISGNMQLVNFLLANGADVNSLDAEKHSVVHWATVCGETGALGAVLSAGAQVSTPDVHGGFPLHYASQMCGSEKSDLGLQVLHILLSETPINVTVEDNDGRQPLLWAASAGSARAVLALVRAGATVEASDKDGLTALHCAASRGHTDTLDTLLTLCGATPDVIDTNGCTALHYSVTLGHADATALLLTHGADPNRQDRKGRSPAHCGCAKGQLETVRQLGSHGANLWLRNARGDLPLHEAAASGRRPLVRWLLDQRPSQVNARNNDGRCPLHLAALNDNADMCKILLDAGAQVNPILRTSKNAFMTPLDCALQRGFRSTAKFLQLHGGVPASRLTNTSTSTVRSSAAEPATKTNLVGSASNIHIREDVTIFGGSSSETDHEEEQNQKKGHRPRRRTVRRRGTHNQRVDANKHLSDSDVNNKDNSDKLSRTENRSKSNVQTEKDGKALKASEQKLKPQLRDKSEDPVKDKQQEVKANGKHLKKKQKEADYSEESQSETDVLTSPEIEQKISPKSNIEIEEIGKKQNGDLSSSNIPEPEKAKENIELEKEVPKKSVQEEGKNGTLRKKKGIKKSSKKEVIEPPVTGATKKAHTKSSKKSDISDSDKNISDLERKKKKHQGEEDVQKDPLKPKDTEMEGNQNEGEKKVTKEPSKTIEESKIEDELKKTQFSEKKDQEIVSHETKSVTDVPQDDKEQMKDETQLTQSKKETAETKTLEDAKHLDDNDFLSKIPQPDQISIQSKLSEGSPSETIVVEASVHHLPRGITPEDLKENLKTSGDADEEKNIVGEAVVDRVNQQEEAIEKSDDKKDIKGDEPLVDANGLSKEIEREIADKKEDGTATAIDTSEVDIDKEKKESDDTKIVEGKKDADKLTKTTEDDTVPLQTTDTDVNNQQKELDDVKEILKEIIADGPQEKKPKPHELNIDLSLKKFEESAGTQDVISEEDGAKSKLDGAKQQKKYKKKISSKTQDGTNVVEGIILSSSESREGSSSDEAEGGRNGINNKGKASEDNLEHKSFTILKDDIAFEVLKDSPAKETRRTKHKSSKKRLKEIERLNESATSSPEMLESIRTRTKSLNRDKDSRSVQSNLDTLSLPPLPANKRSDSNLSAPNLSSVYSDNDDQKSGSNSEVEDNDNQLDSAAKSKRRLKRRKMRAGAAKSAGSDYESSNLIDSGFEPSPRSSRIPKRKVMSERGVNMTSVTQTIQTNIRKYHMERKIFQHLLDLKRLQIRSGQANEHMMVKRAIDTYHNSVAATIGAGRYTKKDYTYRGFEQFLYQSLRTLQKSPSSQLRGLPETSDNPLLCTQSTHRCLHATHAYTGIPCAAYLPKMNHHTMPKIGFTPRSTSSFLPQINAKGKSVTLELCHGNDKQVISLPADRLDHNKRYYVTFTVKGQDTPSPTTTDQQDTTAHRHAKSV